jgi:hypothetical protein
MSMSRRAAIAAQARRDGYHALVCWEDQFTMGDTMEKPMELNDDEIAAVGGGRSVISNIILSMFNGGLRGNRASFNGSLNNNFASFAVNSNNNSFNNSFNTILSFNII